MTVDSEDVIDCMARRKGDGQPFALATVVRTRDATSAKVGAKAVVCADGSMVGWVGGGCTLGAVRKAAAATVGRGLDGDATQLAHDGDTEALSEGCSFGAGAAFPDTISCVQ